MKSSDFRRDATRVLESLKELGNTLVTSSGCRVYFPMSFENYKLAEISGSDVKVLGLFAIALEDNTYGVLNVCTKVKLTPSEINKVIIDEDIYYELVFDKGSIMSDDLDCLKDDVLTYYIYNAIVGKGVVPWYLTYDDLCHVFDTAKEYANANVGNSPEIVALMMSIVARTDKDRMVYYRQVAQSKTNVNERPVFIPINSVEFGATNTLNKLGGNYFEKGVASALITPTDKVETIEAILRH